MEKIVTFCFKAKLWLPLPLLFLGCAPEHWDQASQHQGTEAPSPAYIDDKRVPSRRPADLLAQQEDRQQQGASGQRSGETTEPWVEQGSGTLVGQASPPSDITLSRDDAGAVTLNVVDADIHDVVRLVLAEGLGGNYVIDPAVSGTITVRTSQPVPADEIISILGSVLEMNGAALVKSEGFFRVVPVDDISHSSAKILNNGGGVQVSPLRYADATQLAKMLEPIAEADNEAGRGSVTIDTVRNTLLLAGTPDQITTMTDLIEMFDVDWMAGMSFGLYPLREVSATELAEELEQIFGDLEGGSLLGGLRLVPLDRISALIVIAAQPDMLERAESWVKRLDKVGDGERIHIYEVQHGRATDIASVLGQLFDIESTVIGQDSLLAPGEQPAELRSSFDTSDSDNSDDVEDDTSDASLQGFGGGFSNEASELSQGQTNSTAKIVADENNNSLLIRATALEYRRIEPAIRELDKQRLQVFLETTILEVSLEGELSYGVQWFLGSGNSGLTSSQDDEGAVSSVFPGFSGILSSSEVDVVINALDQVSEVNVVSSPQLLVLDNQTAELEVGDEVPIITVQSESTDDDSIVSTVEQRQTGVILSVTPRVNASGLVVLDIQQEVSDVLETTSSDIDSPTIAQRRVSTSVAVSGEETVVLGGLIQDDSENIEIGIPILRNIPVVGLLFGGTTKITDRTELLVLITPKVMASSTEAAMVTNELRGRFSNLQPLHSKIQ